MVIAAYVFFMHFDEIYSSSNNFYCVDFKTYFFQDLTFENSSSSSKSETVSAIWLSVLSSSTW